MTAIVRCDVPTQMGEFLELAQMLATSQLLPQHLQKRPENVIAIGIAARSIDVPLWQAIQGMQVINGKVGMSADLHRALILREGHTFRVMESTEKVAHVVGIRADDPERFEHHATFTIADAMTAGIANGVSWKKYPKAMLVARATTLLARNAFSDVIAGMSYTPEELGAEVDEDGTVIPTIRKTADAHRPVEREKVTTPPVDEWTVVEAVPVEAEVIEPVEALDEDVMQSWRDTITATDSVETLRSMWTDVGRVEMTPHQRDELAGLINARSLEVAA